MKIDTIVNNIINMEFQAEVLEDITDCPEHVIED